MAIWHMESAVAVLSRYEENAKWIIKHYEELKEKFEDEWVAVLKSTVVDHDQELSKLVERLRTRYPENHDEIVVEYVTAKEIELIL